MNIQIIEGYLAADPELVLLDGGKQLVKLIVMDNKHINDTHYMTKFFCEQWGPIAQTHARSLRKGSHVLIEGETRDHEYTTANNEKRTKKIVNIKELTYLDRNSNNN